MTDKSSLLTQLKIDRSAPAPAELPVWKLWTGAASVLFIGIGSFFFFASGDGVPVKVAVARPATGSSGGGGASLLDASGYVVARRKATVSAKTTGKVVEVLIEEGQRVEEGQILARLDDSNASARLSQVSAQVRQAEAALTAATVAHENAKPLYERNRQLLESGAVSATTHEQSKAAFDSAVGALAVARSGLEVARAAQTVAQRDHEDTVVRAPFAGVVTAKAAQPGEMVSPAAAAGGLTRTGICTIVDMSSLEVQVDVSENFISRVKAGQNATIRLNAYPDLELPGAIIAVIPTADRAKATVQVRVEIKDKNDPRIIPEMGARVSFLADAANTAASSAAPGATSERAPGVIVPAAAVEISGAGGTVYVVRGDKIEKRSVQLGGRNGDTITVLSGVAAGDKLAVGDFAVLKDGLEIEVE
ncbi:MAG: efflux RND transporter periplasmic adaptor subunit [Rhodospirillaceae bacterium]